MKYIPFISTNRIFSNWTLYRYWWRKNTNISSSWANVIICIA